MSSISKDAKRFGEMSLEDLEALLMVSKKDLLESRVSQRPSSPTKFRRHIARILTHLNGL